MQLSTDDFPSMTSIISLLWSGKIIEAKDAIFAKREAMEAARREIEEKRKAAEKQLADLSKQIEQITAELNSIVKLLPPEEAQKLLTPTPEPSVNAAGSAPETATIEQPQSAALAADRKRQRKKVVLNIAKTIAQRHPQRLVTVEQIREELARINYDLGTPHNRINTAITSIVTRCKEFDRIELGVYREKGLELVA